ncbi:MAG: hypothetical protein AB7O65_02705 [Candidatus Korobacteraceae bacterium]
MPAVVLLLFLLRVVGKREEAQKKGDGFLFGPSMAVRVILLGMAILGAALVVGPIFQSGRVDLVTAIIGIVAILCSAAFIPSSILISPDSIQAKWLVGTESDYSVVECRCGLCDTQRHEMLVYGSNQQIVKHSQFHVDGPAFRAKVARRIKKIDGF